MAPLHGAALQPYAVVSARRSEVGVPYHDVPVPTATEVSKQIEQLPALSRASGRVNVTPLLDMCLRFACLAYRRNAPTTSTALPLYTTADTPAFAVELQFRAATGAHAVAYLYHSVACNELYAVLSFKGSTLSSPGAPVLSDWVHNLQPLPGDNQGLLKVHSGFAD